MKSVDEIINKSLEDIDSIIADMEKGKAPELDIAKGIAPQVPPEEVSQDAPPEEEDTEGEEDPEAGEGAPEAGDDEAGDEPAPEEEDTDEDTEKSLEGNMKSREGVRKALEVSEFLSELVKSLSEVIEGQKVDINKSIANTQNHTMLLAKSFEGIAKAQRAVLENQASMFKSLDSLNKRLGTIEKQPMARKSVPVAPIAKPIEKSFNASAGIPAPTESTTLSKSEALFKLNAEFEKGNKNVIQDILALEGTGSFNSMSPLGKSILGLK